MIDTYKLKQWLREQINNEKKAVMKYSDSQLLDAGICVGSHDAYARVLDFINANLDKKECQHESNNIKYIMNPGSEGLEFPASKCKKCGEFYK
jgi:hypothetical protein